MIRNYVIAIFLALVTSWSAAQQPSGQVSAAEPELPVVNFAGCLQPQCQGEDVKAEASFLYDGWGADRKQIGKVAEGENVKQYAFVCLTQKPDRYIVKTPVPSLGLNAGDLILRYRELGHDQYDIWVHGGWMRSSKWTKTQGDAAVICSAEEMMRDSCSEYTESNLRHMQAGIVECWNRIQKSDGTKGWTFNKKSSVGHAVAEERLAANTSIHEPKLPFIANDACPGPTRTVPNWKMRGADEIYSSYMEGKTLVGTLKVGDRVTILSGTNVVREPGRAEMRKTVDGVWRRGDVALSYGYRADGFVDFWSNGVWFADYYEGLMRKGGRCGFADQSQCDEEIVTNGKIEWWVQVKTSKGLIGWVRADKSISGTDNFGAVCMLD